MKTVLAISCHPATVEILCAGTLIRYKNNGDKVVICHVSNGNKGGEEIHPEKLGPIRNGEAKTAAGIIGAECISLDVNDLEVDSSDKELQDKIVDVIRRVKPDVIITHSPEDYSPDLLAVSRLVCNSSLLASMFHYKTNEKPLDAAAPIYFMDTFAGIDFVPTDYVDISDTIQTKIDMLWKHESVLKWLLDKKCVDFADFVRTSAHYRGMQCGVAYAEAFHAYHKWMYVRPERLLP